MAHHFFEAITNTTGDSLVGYFARVIDPSSLNTIPIYSDNNGTPVRVVSGVENMATTDESGNLSFYVDPGTYHLDIYQPDATTFVKRVQNVAMNSTKGDKGDKGDAGNDGPAGPADAFRINLAALQSAATTDGKSDYDNSTWYWTLGNFTAQAAAYPADYVASNGTPLTIGAWVRQTDTKLPHIGPLGRESVDQALQMSRPGSRADLSQIIDLMQSGQPVSIAVYGDSIPYGQDTSVNGATTGLPFNGSMVPRSKSPWPETLEASLAINQFGATVSVVNRGYPGDTTRMGLERWSDPAIATPVNIAIIAYGINDGKTRSVPIDQYKRDQQAFIEREIAKGKQFGIKTVPVLLTATPVKERDVDSNIDPYRVAVKQLAEEYGYLCIDTAELLAGVTDLWCGIDVPSGNDDLVHLSTYGGGELGWELGSLFVNRDLARRQIVAGSMWYPQDTVGWGGAITADAAASSGSFTVLAPGQRYFISAYFDDDVLPVIHNFNADATAAKVVLQYGGFSSTTPFRGLAPITLDHVAARGQRQSIAGNVLRRGYRTLIVFNDGTVPVKLDKFEFVSVSDGGMLSYGLMKPLPGLSPAFIPKRVIAALPDGSFAGYADYGTLLKAPYSVSALVSLGAGDLQGIAIFTDRDNANVVNPSTGTFLFLTRNGTDLLLREFVAGAITTTTATAVFDANDWRGQLELVVTPTVAKVYVDGVEKISKDNPTTRIGYPGLMQTKAATGAFHCIAAMAAGNVKMPFPPKVS